MDKNVIIDKVKTLILRGVIPEIISSNNTREVLIRVVDERVEKYVTSRKNGTVLFKNEGINSIDEYIWVLSELVENLGDDFKLNTRTSKFLFEIKDEFVDNSYEYIKDLFITIATNFLLSKNDDTWIGHQNKYVKYIKSRKFLTWTSLNIILFHKYVREKNDDILDLVIKKEPLISVMKLHKAAWFQWIDYDIFSYDGNTHYTDVNLTENDEETKKILLKIPLFENEKVVIDMISNTSYYLLDDKLSKMVYDALIKNIDQFKKDFC